MSAKYSIRDINLDKEEVPLHLLLDADPSEKQIRCYLPISHLFGLFIENQIRGVLVITPMKQQELEIKNLAIDAAFRGQGFGKMLIRFAIDFARSEGCKAIWIGTANSSVFQLALYQKMGFELHDIKYHFFTEQYEEPIWENGIQAKHLLLLSQILN
jgi:ribosomal protein S18 acetylase RimI-like enzyme